MKKIIISSILAATACLSMVGQANAAPHSTQYHASQAQNQKHDNKANNKHKQTKHKAKGGHYQSKAAPAKHKMKDKHQGKHVESHRG